MARTAANSAFLAPRFRKIALLTSLVRRELDARYRGALLGRAWPLITQAAQLIVFTYLFSAIFKVRLHLQGLGDNPGTYGLWLFAGFVPWTAFSTAIAQGSNSVLAAQNLVKKVVFPLELLPLTPVLAAFVESLAGLGALLVLLAAITRNLHATVVLLPLIWIPQLLLTAGLAYALSALTVFIRDIPQALAPILLVWFYLTPVVYPSGSVPQQMAALTTFNPLAYIVRATRDVLIFGNGIDARTWLFETLGAGVVFGLGFALYSKLRPAFADVL